MAVLLGPARFRRQHRSARRDRHHGGLPAFEPQRAVGDLRAGRNGRGGDHCDKECDHRTLLSIELPSLPSFDQVGSMADSPTRCAWRGMAGDPLYEAYHDTEWGVPEYDPRTLWEKLVLDGFQALSLIHISEPTRQAE